MALPWQEIGKVSDKDYLYDLLVHDLTGPLSVVATSVSRLLKTEKCGGLTEVQRSTLERALRNTKKAQLLLHQMIEVSRSEEQLFSRDQVYVEELVKECVLSVVEVMDQGTADKVQTAGNESGVWGVLEQSGILVDITGRYKASPFLHDRKKIRQILENLMSNALKYRRRRMSVTVSGEGDLTISVSDDGQGIPDEEHKRLFHRFKQLKNATSATAPGLGLGLYCVKSLVETMGGELTLQSTEGWGTTFVVRIPSLDRDCSVPAQ